MSDFDRIARVIRNLDQRASTQPPLAELAADAGLSPSHFHRLFRRWAGVTPKDFLQCLTVQFARERLRASASVLDTALDAGLSGPGRLHDLMVSLEAASPGEWKRRGEGLEIGWGQSDTPFGPATLAWSPRGLCHLSFLDVPLGNAPPERLLRDWGRASLAREDDQARNWCGRIFRPEPTVGSPLRAHVHGTAFQLKVWRALLQIPPGGLVSYGQLARGVGVPGASRAVGSACGHNPVAFLIPCHRVIRETGIVEGYRWGTVRKRALLAWEGAATPVGVRRRPS